VSQVGNALAELGVEMEHRVAILLPQLSRVQIGAVAAPISYAVTPDEQAFLLADSRARAMVTTASLWAPLRRRRHDFPFVRHALVVGPGASGRDEHDFLDSLPKTATGKIQRYKPR